MSEKDYRKLYLTQDKVLLTLKSVLSSFYLTGGTALGRFYLSHRFSEDLDFFLNNSDDFHSSVKNIEFGLIDTPLNILTNKLSALIGRDEPKDVFDIYALSKHYAFNWLEVFEETKNKAIINELDVEKRITSFPTSIFKSVDWHIHPIDIETVSKDIKKIANDFFLGTDNSFGKNKPAIEVAEIIKSDILKGK